MDNKINSQRAINKSVLVSFILGYGGAIIIFTSIESDTGNGGAFVAMTAIFILCLGALVTTILGFFATAYAIINKSQTQKGALNSIWFPLLLSSPPFIYLAWQYTIHVIL